MHVLARCSGGVVPCSIACAKRAPARAATATCSGAPVRRALAAQAAPRFNSAARRCKTSRKTAVAVKAAAATGEYVVVKETLPGNAVKLTITVPGPVCQKCFTKAVDMLKRDVVGDLKGFRKGNVPLSMIINRVGGQDNFKRVVLEETLLQAMNDVLPQHAARAVPESERVLTDARQMAAAFDPAKPMVFEVGYDVMPEVKWVRPYSGISVTVQDTGNLSTDEAAAQDLIRQYLKEKAQQRVVADRGLQNGDVAILGMTIAPAAGGEPYPGLVKDAFVFDTEADPLGMAPHMQGMTPGEERSWEFTFDDDWHVELWRGQRAKAKVKVQELFSWIMPEFNDAWVQKHYPKFESAVDMRKSLVATTTMERLKAMEAQVQDRIIEQVAACVQVQVPESVVQQLGSREYESRLLQMIQRGVATPESAEKMMTEAMVAEFVAEKRDELEERCRWVLAADAIFEEQGLKLDEEALAAEVERALEDLHREGSVPDPNDPAAREFVKADVAEKARNATVMGWLQQNVKIDVLPFGDGSAPAPAQAAGAPPAAAAAAAT